MVIQLIKDINDELNDKYHNDRINVISKSEDILKKIFDPGKDDVKDLLQELIMTSGTTDPNILIPLIPDKFSLHPTFEDLTNQKIDNDITKRLNLIYPIVIAKEIGVFEKIEEIKNITDDEEYREAIYNLIWNRRFDKDGYPQELHIDHSVLELFHRKNSDQHLIQKAKTEAHERRVHIYNWEEHFITLDYLIKNVMNQIKDSNVQFTDYTISQLYSECYIEKNDNDEKKELKKALFELFKKYPNFKPKGESRYRILNPDNIKSDPKEKSNFKIIPSKPFYKDNPDFDPNHRFIKFLNESRQVPLNPNMLLVPFKIKIKDERKFKTIYYYFTVNNRSESINLRFTDTGFEYANQQSNFYYQLRSAITPEFRKDYHNFEEYIFKQLQTATGFNTKLIKEIYDGSKDIINNKYIDLTQTEM